MSESKSLSVSMSKQMQPIKKPHRRQPHGNGGRPGAAASVKANEQPPNSMLDAENGNNRKTILGNKGSVAPIQTMSMQARSDATKSFILGGNGKAVFGPPMYCV